MKYIDLHVHSVFSDGTLTPQKIVEYAVKRKLSAIALTDHDTTDGVPIAQQHAQQFGLEVVPGVELSVEMPGRSDLELHILGYYLDYQDESFQERLSFFRKKRHERAVLMLEKLKDLNVFLDGAKLLETTNDNAIGRLHFAQSLLEEGYVHNIQEAFQRFIGFNKPAYVPKARLMPEQAIKMITDVDGIPVLAHPYFSEINRDMIALLVGFGLKGIEVYHSRHSKSDIDRFRQYASEFNLLITGGSDCHGEIDKNEALLGNMEVSFELLEKMQEFKRGKV
ncbi:MAG: PHP domain-containing protein [bacterium]|nr:PHP domain-containing protein [bacterium]